MKSSIIKALYVFQRCKGSSGSQKVKIIENNCLICLGIRVKTASERVFCHSVSSCNKPFKTHASRKVSRTIPLTVRKSSQDVAPFACKSNNLRKNNSPVGLTLYILTITLFPPLCLTFHLQCLSSNTKWYGTSTYE